MQLKKCPACARAIAQASTICSYCGRADADPEPHGWVPGLEIDALPALENALEHGAPPLPTPAPQEPPPPGSSVPTAAPATRDFRRFALLAAGVLGGGVLIAGVLGGRGADVPAVATARVEAATVKRSAPAAGPERPAAPAFTWSRVIDGRWVGSDRRSVAFELPAVNKIQVWTRQVRPVLVVRCLSRSTDVFVFTQSAAQMEPQDEDHSVRIRLDDGGERKERWPDSVEHDALFAPDGAALARQLLTARTLHFGFAPHNAQPAVAQFELAGLADQLAPVAKSCGWK